MATRTCIENIRYSIFLYSKERWKVISFNNQIKLPIVIVCEDDYLCKIYISSYSDEIGIYLKSSMRLPKKSYRLDPYDNNLINKLNHIANEFKFIASDEI